MKFRKEKGITLIALVVTIIILLILAGVVLNLIIGNHGMINRTKTAKEEYTEAQAREKLELVLVDLQTDKVLKSEYNDTTYINTKLKSQGFGVGGDTVSVDGWLFEIDRSVPKIVESLGRGEVEIDIMITATSSPSADFVKASVTVEIEYEGTITQIMLNEREITVPAKNAEGKYVVTINDITENGTYSLVVKDGDKKATRSVIVAGISEDIEIRNVNELVAFRDRVNNGATFEGRTITLASDIDLAGVCNRVDGTTANDNSWIPIGTNEKRFKGTFNGNNHTINHLYINTTNGRQGLFGAVENATISHVKIGTDSQVKGGNQTAGIVGHGNNFTIEYCMNNATINGNTYTGGIVGSIHSGVRVSNCGNTGDITSLGYSVGGIVGVAFADSNINVSGCYNTGNITSRGKDPSGNGLTGGIIGFYYHGSGTIQNCYNTGTIDATYPHIGGIAGNRDTGPLIANCYNTGNFLGSTTIRGSISGYSKGTKFTNCYWTTAPNCAGSTSGTQTSCSKKTEAELKELASTLGDAFVADGKIKNAQGQWVDHKDAEDNIIYINNGFPVLKWQVEK